MKVAVGRTINIDEKVIIDTLNLKGFDIHCVPRKELLGIIRSAVKLNTNAFLMARFEQGQNENSITDTVIELFKMNQAVYDEHDHEDNMKDYYYLGYLYKSSDKTFYCSLFKKGELFYLFRADSKTKKLIEPLEPIKKFANGSDISGYMNENDMRGFIGSTNDY